MLNGFFDAVKRHGKGEARMKSKFLLLVLGLVITAIFLSPGSPLPAAQQPNWNVWVKQLRTEAISQGIRPQLFDAIFKDIRGPSRKVLSLDRRQPEGRLTFLKYRKTRADAFRIKLGRQEYRKHRQLLNEIGRRYGVSPCFIVALWGLESSYGRYMGNFPVVQSLATLAYDTRRSAFFRKQLLYALHILNEGHVKLKDFKGEWAGASGQPQFLPSSWRNYAVDHNNDGKKDIWKTHGDIFASIANYLKQHGWKTDQPWAVEVRIPPHLNPTLANNKSVHKSVAEWRELGLRTVNGRPWPNDQLQARLIHPYGGPYMLAFNNFGVIMKWNRSNYYAGTVGWTAEQICGRSL